MLALVLRMWDALYRLKTKFPPRVNLLFFSLVGHQTVHKVEWKGDELMLSSSGSNHGWTSLPDRGCLLRSP